MRELRGIALTAVLLGALWAAPTASATIPDVFGGDVSCSVQGDGTRHCGSTSPRSTTPTFDGVPIDVNVSFPPESSSGPDGGYPLMMMFHGYGGSKIGFGGMRRFVDRGYAVFSMTDRGFHESCGSAASRAADPSGCEDGYVRLLDTRYEVRDAQELAGELVDEGVVDPQRIGAIGGSYGGGMSMSLAALRDRKMLADGSLVPWRSPGGTPMRIAAATPEIPWTDLAYSLTPNGSTLDYVADAPYRGRFGILKQSYVDGLYLSGLGAPGFYAPEGTDPEADLTGWRSLLNQGEPYDGNPAAQRILDEITAHHSSYYVDHSQPPAPLLISNGLTDDLFPGDEAVRFYNRTRSQYPDAPIALFFADFGHPRGQNKPADGARLEQLEDAWLDHFVIGEGPAPQPGVEVLTQTCPGAASSAGPYRADSWARLAPGEVRFSEAGSRTVSPDAGSDAIAERFNPLLGGGGACAQASGADQEGAASYPLPPAPKRGYTLAGSPTVIADITLAEPNSQLAARLLDVGPDGQETLVARALWRPRTGGPHEQVLQLHPNAWRFEPGHAAKLELLPKDSGTSALRSYGRPSDGQGPVEVADLELRLPVLEKPGVGRGAVGAPAPKLVPEGYELAADFAALPDRKAKPKGRPKANRRRVRAKVKCPGAWHACHAKVEVRKRGKAKRAFRIAKGKTTVAGGESRKAKLKLTRRARKRLRGKRRVKVRVRVTAKEQAQAVSRSRVLKLRRAR